MPISVPENKQAASLGAGIGLLLAIMTGLALAQAPQPGRHSSLTPARDLAGEAKGAAAQGKAYVVLFSETGCPWCERARQEFLLPMQADAQLGGKAVFRQVNIDSDEVLRDFNGRTSSHRRFAQAEGVRMYPTVALYTPEGKPAADRLTGFTNAVYYGSSIERRIDAALAGIAAAQPRNPPPPARK